MEEREGKRSGGSSLVIWRVRMKGGGETRGHCCGTGDPWEALAWATGAEGHGEERGEKARVQSAETALILLQ